MNADAVFFGAHPDDVELSSGGFAAALAADGARVVIVDATRGESASRGTVEERAREADEAARLLGVAARDNLALPDTGLSRADRAQQRAVIECLRRHRPALVVAPDPEDVHSDHVELSALVARGAYLAGLRRYAADGDPHRPGRVLYAMYRTTRSPHLVLDVSAFWEQKMAAVHAHVSQIDPAHGPRTYLTQPGFLEGFEAHARGLGALFGVRYAEGYRTRAPLLIERARTLVPGGAAAATTSATRGGA